MTETKNRCVYISNGEFMCTNTFSAEHSDCSYRVDPVGEISALCPQYKICKHISGVECTCIQACREAVHTFAEHAMERCAQAQKEWIDATNLLFHLKTEEDKNGSSI